MTDYSFHLREGFLTECPLRGDLSSKRFVWFSINLSKDGPPPTPPIARSRRGESIPHAQSGPGPLVQKSAIHFTEPRRLEIKGSAAATCGNGPLAEPPPTKSSDSEVSTTRSELGTSPPIHAGAWNLTPLWESSSRTSTSVIAQPSASAEGSSHNLSSFLPGGWDRMFSNGAT